MSLALDFSQPLELSFLEAAFLGNEVGYTMPQFVEVSWASREDAIEAFEGATKAFKALTSARLEFWTQLLERHTQLEAETLLLCPWGGFMALVVRQNVRGVNRFSISAFTGKKKPTKSFAQKPFMNGYGQEASEMAYTLQRLNDHQVDAKPYDNPHKVGDVFCASSGYEQTNIAFYQVTAVKGLMVTVREIECETHYHMEDVKDSEGRVIRQCNSMTGVKAPLINLFKGEEINRKVKPSGGIDISSYESAHALEYTEQFGTRIYNAVNFSCYG